MNQAEKTIGVLEKVIASLVLGVIGVFVGIVVRLFVATTGLSSLGELFALYLPWMVGFSFLFGLFGWIYPKIGCYLVEIITGQ